jgi:lipopolysaccharide export system permease protein
VEEKNINTAARKYPSRKDYFKEQTIVISLTGFDLERSEDGLFKSNSAMLNISRLTFFIDSLNMKHNERINNQFNEFNNSKLYSQRNAYKRPTNRNVVADSIIKNKIMPEPRVVFDSLPETDKSAVLSRAIANLKDGTSYLSERNETLHWEVKVIRKYEVEWNRKLTMSFACLVFFFIGAPLGAIIRKGGLGTPSVISIFFFVIYYVISISGQKLVEEDVVGTFAGMWAASYILLPIGIFLTYKATTDSVIMNIDTYLVFLKKIKDYIYRIAIMGNGSKPVSD